MYLGISPSKFDELEKRQAEHKRASHWCNLSVRVGTATFPTRDAAPAAELEAIRTEKPLYNIVGRAAE
jgi:hypothetical protein